MHFSAINPDAVQPLDETSLAEVLKLLQHGFRLATDFAGAAQMSGLSRSLLYKAAASGDLRVYKAGGRSVILVRDLQRFLEECLPRAHFRDSTSSSGART